MGAGATPIPCEYERSDVPGEEWATDADGNKILLEDPDETGCVEECAAGEFPESDDCMLRTCGQGETPDANHCKAPGFDAASANYQDMMDPDKDLNRFIDLGYKFVTTDATKGIGQDRVVEKPINAKKCTAEDLELDEQEAIDLFALWGNSTLICPDWDPDLKTLIKGDTSSILTRNLVFEIESCMKRERMTEFITR